MASDKVNQNINLSNGRLKMTCTYDLHRGDNLVTIPLVNINGQNNFKISEIRQFQRNIYSISSGDSSCIYDKENGWMGSLEEIYPGNGYWITATEDYKFELERDPLFFTYSILVIVAGIVVIGFSAGFSARKPKGF